MSDNMFSSAPITTAGGNYAAAQPKERSVSELRNYVVQALRRLPKKATRQEQADAVLAALQQRYVVSERW